MSKPPPARGPRRPTKTSPKRPIFAGRPSAPPARGRPHATPSSRSVSPPTPSRPRVRPTTLFVATRNPGKARELADLLSDAPFRVIGPEVIANYPAPVEDGATFEANARKKALHYSALLHPDTLVLADDSGLEVDALGGQPGVRSARLGGPTASDADRVRLIMSRLETVPWERRAARFKCVLAVAQKHKDILATFEGEVEGRIAFEPAGAEGFGYDPIFFYLPLEMTFAQMNATEKNHVSHRGRALAKLGEWLVAWAKERSRRTFSNGARGRSKDKKPANR